MLAKQPGHLIIFLSPHRKNFLPAQICASAGSSLCIRGGWVISFLNLCIRGGGVAFLNMTARTTQIVKQSIAYRAKYRVEFLTKKTYSPLCEVQAVRAADWRSRALLLLFVVAKHAYSLRGDGATKVNRRDN